MDTEGNISFNVMVYLSCSIVIHIFHDFFM